MAVVWRDSHTRGRNAGTCTPRMHTHIHLSCQTKPLCFAEPFIVITCSYQRARASHCVPGETSFERLVINGPTICRGDMLLCEVINGCSGVWCVESVDSMFNLSVSGGSGLFTLDGR